MPDDPRHIGFAHVIYTFASEDTLANHVEMHTALLNHEDIEKIRAITDGRCGFDAAKLHSKIILPTRSDAAKIRDILHSRTYKSDGAMQSALYLLDIRYPT